MLEKLQRLCESALKHDAAFNFEFYDEARKAVPLLIDVAKAADAWDDRDQHGMIVDTSPQAIALGEALAKLKGY